MKVAAFNVENLFSRAEVLSLATWAEGKPTLEKFAEVSALLQEPSYQGVEADIIQGLTDPELDKSDTGRGLVLLRQNRGKLVKRPRGKPMTLEANGRDDWIGWLELREELVNEVAIDNAARVLAEVDADVYGIVEAEDRPSLIRFNDDIVSQHNASFPNIMLIDGNDRRGIDVAVMAKKGFEIEYIQSHVDDEDGDGIIFSRDCPEFTIETPGGDEVLVMVNHFKSKGFGSQASSNKKRTRQAERVATLYRSRRLKGIKNIVVMGDLNDTPDRDPLKPLIEETSLKDVTDSSAFIDDGHPGTFGNGNKSQKIDYVLLSPDLFSKVTSAGIFRKGVWGNKNGDRWPIFPSMTRKIHQASDHAAVWADLAL